MVLLPKPHEAPVVSPHRGDAELWAWCSGTGSCSAGRWLHAWPRPWARDQPWDRKGRYQAGQLVFVQAPQGRVSGTPGLRAHPGSKDPTLGPRAGPMWGLSFCSTPLPRLSLLLLLSLRPAWAPEPPGVAPSEPPGARECPEACACSAGGQANCSALALPFVPAGLSWRVYALLLDRNCLRALPPGAFAGAHALRLLDLRENGLRSVHSRAFWGLGALQLLDLSANQLETLAPGTFAPLRALRSLSLAGNRLALLEPAVVGALPGLRALSLQDNALSALGPGLLARLPALDALGLHGNPWACGCALRPLCNWLRLHPRVSEAETLRCVSPGRRTLSPLSAFPDAAFRHCTKRLAARDLAVIYALGPVSFLASLATCLALGSAITACRARSRRRRLPVARSPSPRPLDPAGPACVVAPESQAATPAQA
ncbi:leucine-rich repeat-containing protein 26 [Heterocephalus glaber]|uniref:Leucine-rich repeat-containing protein 26 n=1 Tax=Heterocephalus glaber TaxID=10181 RepID=A0AAX6TB25_HETGA|nr:leucine-rich repeat-containing protein 26 [Heterocephalus glaber]XP_021117283.1 leucine-rich repeat-containing protein 26 [Heterocephalus glaber]XP_021117284.1 leucine-rich repeat-containing protein 26 [Heterocephalus glaber]